jgi:DNA repair protein RadC
MTPYATHDAHAARPLASWVRLLGVAEDHELWRETADVVRSDDDVARLMGPRLAAEEVEVMIVVPLDGLSRVIAAQEIARGGAHGLAVTAREIFRTAVALGASAIVLTHNHPSGCPEPSAEDDAMTAAVRDAGALLGVPLIDHVIIAGRSRWYGYLAHGRLDTVGKGR